jgi:hypothetical protein
MLPSVLIIKVSSPFIPLAPCQLSDASHEDALDDDHVIVTSSSTKTFIGSAEIETVGSGMGAGSGVLLPPPPPHETKIKEVVSKILVVSIMAVFLKYVFKIYIYT